MRVTPVYSGWLFQNTMFEIGQSVYVSRNTYKEGCWFHLRNLKATITEHGMLEPLLDERELRGLEVEEK